MNSSGARTVIPVLNPDFARCRVLTENDKFLMDDRGSVVGIEYEDGERQMYADMFSYRVVENDPS